VKDYWDKNILISLWLLGNIFLKSAHSFQLIFIFFFKRVIAINREVENVIIKL